MTTSTDALPTGSRAEAGKKRATLKPARPMFRMIVEAATVLATIAVQSRAFLVAPLGRGVRLGAPQLAPGASYSSVVRMAYNFERSPNTWKDDEGDIEPGFGGVWPGDPNAKTHNVKFVNKEGESVASVDVPVDRYIFFAAEDANVDVPIVNKRRMCRNGCCTTCAVKVLEGKVKPEGALGLLKELKEDGYALTCCSYPKSDLVLEVQAEDEVYMRQFGEGFEGGGVEWGGVFLDED